ncbi:hypothetical protein PF0761 [Pyrococcus furiosus DSM 3638]|uniref:Uncharacterized protein n=1 Tax=Pyrococcus furiosus (strain ATCC 43587 / DSM 3638 / JCM 8422 / Vc1) TaxID=186497 RepID=Q8U2S0_PYRFU|nr:MULTISPECIES: ATP-binding protein [Pyrococcus]AAL80885.1 hypothetical protein PF0761 [Pyrococcus furiosus DSM 3638]MDK2870474.1 hypothetical protein [Pyrococcus sp.]
MYLKGEVETFPGRRGKGKDIVMNPLSFGEFVKVARPDIYSKLPRIKRITKVKECSKLRPWREELYDLFILYLKSGGFPRAVKDILEGESIAELHEPTWNSIQKFYGPLY